MAVADNFVRKAVITRIVDGDTVIALVDLGFGIHTEVWVRLLGVNTPERWQQGYAEATKFTTDTLLNKEVYMQTQKTDGFHRYLATIFLEDGTVFNDLLLERGLAKEYKKK